MEWRLRYPGGMAVVRHPKKIGCRSGGMAAVRHPKKMGCRPSGMASEVSRWNGG